MADRVTLGRSLSRLAAAGLNGDDFIVWQEVEYAKVAMIGPIAGADQADTDLGRRSAGGLIGHEENPASLALRREVEDREVTTSPSSTFRWRSRRSPGSPCSPWHRK